MEENSGPQGQKPDDARVEITSDEGGRVGVLDIRPSEEFGEQHIPGSMHAEEADAEALSAELREQEKIERWLVVCADGNRSREFAGQLAEHGVEADYLEGGMERWVKDKKPIQPPASDKEYEGPRNNTLY
jgi:rhodanese-related sulfurtransferase